MSETVGGSAAVMTTAGGLVFSGGTHDRYFRAFDAATGRMLWQHRTNSGITGVPSSRARHGDDRAARRRRLGVRAEALTVGIDLGDRRRWDGDDNGNAEQ